MIRETVLMIHPFMALKEVETQVVLPSQVYDHPFNTSLAGRVRAVLRGRLRRGTAET